MLHIETALLRVISTIAREVIVRLLMSINETFAYLCKVYLCHTRCLVSSDERLPFFLDRSDIGRYFSLVLLNFKWVVIGHCHFRAHGGASLLLTLHLYKSRLVLQMALAIMIMFLLLIWMLRIVTHRLVHVSTIDRALC